MTRTATVALSLQSIDIPQGRTLSHHQVHLTKDGAVESEAVETLDGVVSFEGLEPGTYFATACSIADDGSVLAGPFISESVVVPRPADEAGQQAMLVNSLTLTLEPDMNDSTTKTNSPESQKNDDPQTAESDPNNTLEHQGNAAGHSDQAEVAKEAATTKTDDGTATTGPSDA